VRTQLAYYFLRYDNALLKHGLLTVDYGSEDLIGLLWAREGARNGAFQESPSNTLMRDWIRANADWFRLSAACEPQLAANEKEFARLQTTWKAPAGKVP
jgi:hypothetical protein